MEWHLVSRCVFSTAATHTHIHAFIKHNNRMHGHTHTGTQKYTGGRENYKTMYCVYYICLGDFFFLAIINIRNNVKQSKITSELDNG